MSKRKLKYLVVHGLVSGWNDPRMMTLEGLKRRGYSANVINKFCKCRVARTIKTWMVVSSRAHAAVPRPMAIQCYKR